MRRHLLEDKPWKEKLHHQKSALDKKLKEEASMKEENERDRVMPSYPLRALDRRLQEDWGRDAREGPTILMSLKVDFRPMTWAKYELTYLCILD